MSENRIDRETRDQYRDLARQTLEAYRRLNEVAARGVAAGNGGTDAVSEAGEVLQQVVNRLRRNGGGSERGQNSNRANGSDH